MQVFTPRKNEKDVISMRISVETLKVIDEKSAEFGISRNEFINQCIDFALANLENNKK